MFLSDILRDENEIIKNAELIISESVNIPSECDEEIRFRDFIIFIKSLIQKGNELLLIQNIDKISNKELRKLLEEFNKKLPNTSM